jgi:uncharacterized protein YkwD
MRRWVGLAVACAAAAAPLSGLAVPAAVAPVAAAAATTVGSVYLNGYEAALVADINAARADHGLRALVVTAGTTDVARRWSWRLASAQALSHNPSIVTNLEHAGSAAWSDIAENVGEAPSDDPQMLFGAYMDSPPHRANILDPAARFLGVGVVERAGTAWNTLDFTDAYSSTYGRTRVPAAGMTIDRKVITAATDLASLEQADQRFGTTRSGGVGASRVYFTGPSARNDSAFAYLRRTSRASGHGDVLMRDALDLSQASTLSLQLASHDRRGRAVAVQVILSRSYGPSLTLGTVQVGATPRWVTLPVPAGARSFQTTVTLRLGSTTLTTAGGSARLNLYDVRAGA